MTATRLPHGFTLIELLVAVAIFAVVAAIAYGSVDALIDARERLQASESKLRALQTSLSTFERDVRSAVARPAREAYGEARPALIGDRGGLTFTRLRSGGLADAAPQAQRIGYALTRQRWTRLEWPVADAAPSTVPRVATLLGEVEGVALRYLDNEGVWREVWPAAQVPAQQRLSVLPRAIDLRVIVAGFGELKRIIELPEPTPP